MDKVQQLCLLGFQQKQVKMVQTLKKSIIIIIQSIKSEIPY